MGDAEFNYRLFHCRSATCCNNAGGFKASHILSRTDSVADVMRNMTKLLGHAWTRLVKRPGEKNKEREG